MKKNYQRLITTSLLISLFVFCSACEKDLLNTVESINKNMVSIQGGTFEMGCTDDDTECDTNEFPQHTVTISPFEISKYEITQGQWEAVMGENPSNFIECGSDCPVEQVSWNDIQEFITQLNSQTGESYGLPTEAEWEYAARAGTTTKWYCGNNESCVDDIAWSKDNSVYNLGFIIKLVIYLHPVGQKTPNAWGLYDLSGNAWEWVQDLYGDYPSDSVTNPTGSDSGSVRIIRGGSCREHTSAIRSASRNYLSPIMSDIHLGFRLSRSPVYKERYIISGTVSGEDVQEGVTITLIGDDSYTTTTDVNGDYSFSELTNGSYIITPSKNDYTFAPKSRKVTIPHSTEIGVDFAVCSSVDRFLDNNDGTVTDCRTDLIWLKNANCFDWKVQSDAMRYTRQLRNEECGLTDGSAPHDWRLPTRNELQGLGTDPPAIWEVEPLVIWTTPDTPFDDVQTNWYWSSTDIPGRTYIYRVGMSYGYVSYVDPNRGGYVWPVRSAN